MKSSKYIIPIAMLASLVAGVFLSTMFSSTVEESNADVMIERIKSVKKLVVTEGYVTEIYTHDQYDKYWSFTGIKKKALIQVNAKVLVSYDLEQMDYQVDEKSKIVTLVNIPAPEITIEPQMKYYDIQSYTFYSFDADDYTKMNKEATALLKSKVKKSDIVNIARKNLETSLNDIQIVGKELGWKVVIPKT